MTSFTASDHDTRDKTYTDLILQKVKELLSESLHLMVSDLEMSADEIVRVIQDEIKDLKEYHKKPYQTIEKVEQQLGLAKPLPFCSPKFDMYDSMMMNYSDTNALTFSSNWMSDDFHPDVIKASNSGDL